MNLIVAVCGSFEREARLALEAEGLDEVGLVSYAPDCRRLGLTREYLADLVARAGTEGHVDLLGGRCCALRPATAPPGCSVHCWQQCFHLVAPPALVDHLLESGAYLATPGWLSAWRSHLDALGLDAPTARMMFGESLRRVVLLDTGVDPEVDDHLRDFGAAVGLPTERLPIGIDPLRNIISRIVLTSTLQAERAEVLTLLGAAGRSTADLAAAFDLISVMADLTEEGRVIEHALTTFQMLFAARRVVYVPIVHGRVATAIARPPGPVDEEALLARLADECGHCCLGSDGFLVRVEHGGERMGLIAVEGIAYPDHLEGDVVFASMVARVCGLAITNARKYERIGRDLLEREHLHTQVESHRARLLEADRRKDEFLAMLSHELRNPLAPIRSSLWLLGRFLSGEDRVHRAYAIIDRQVAHLARLVDDLLNVTRITRGKIQLRCERVELDGLVRRVVEDQRSGFEDAGVALVLRPASQEIWLHGDPVRLAQVVGNLLGNAVKFTPAGGRAEVSVDGDLVNRVATVTIRDTGAGIAPDLLDQVFEPFTQADRTLDRSTGGLGLGLAVVKGIVELHGGSVRARSDGPGRGAEFTLHLPIVPAASEPAGAVLTPPARVGRRILVIVGDHDAAQSLRLALELEGHAVEVATQGREGLERADHFAPDVVFCDIVLPDLDGYAVARGLRERPACRSCCLVALTSPPGPEELRRLSEAGFDRHLVRPPEIREIAQVVEALRGGLRAATW